MSLGHSGLHSCAAQHAVQHKGVQVDTSIRPTCAISGPESPCLHVCLLSSGRRFQQGPPPQPQDLAALAVRLPAECDHALRWSHCLLWAPSFHTVYFYLPPLLLCGLPAFSTDATFLFFFFALCFPAGHLVAPVNITAVSPLSPMLRP